MRILTLKGLLNENLNWYLKQNYPECDKRFNTLFELAKTDHRIATMGQAWFIAQEKFDKADEFYVFTHRKYKSIQEFLSSNDKYALEYRRKTENDDEDKVNYMNLINKVIIEYSISHYSISKNLNIPQQNISAFFSRKNYKALSNQKLMDILKFVNQKAKEIDSKKI